MLRASLPGPTLAGGPLAHDPRAAAEPGLAQAAPEFRAATAPALPLRRQSLRPVVEGAFAGSEHVVASAAQNAANSLARHAGHLDGGLDAMAVMMQRTDLLVHLFLTLPASPLYFLRLAEHVGIDVVAADRAAKMAHVPADDVEEGYVGILQQVPPINDLQRLRGALGGSFAIATFAIPAHDFDAAAGTLGEPVGEGASLSVRQEIDDPARLEIAQDRPITLPLGQAKLSMPTTFTQAGGGVARRRKMRSSVSALTGMDKRSASRAPGRPPSTRAMPWVSRSRRDVRRAWDATVS